MYYLLSVASVLFEISCKMRGFFIFFVHKMDPFFYNILKNILGELSQWM